MNPRTGDGKALRVVQWTTGNVGREAAKAVLAHPDLELVGCYAHGADKVGRDVGELCGVEPAGVVATDDVAALLALQPDCVVYTALFPDIDQQCRILEAGINIVTSAAFVTGWGVGDEAKRRLDDAARRGGASLFGSGMNPGFNNLLAIVSAGFSRRVDKVKLIESADASVQQSRETLEGIGMGLDTDDPEAARLAEAGSRVFGDGVCLVADAMGWELDAIRCEPSFARATEDIDLGWIRVDRGRIAGVNVRWLGMTGERCVVEFIGQYVLGTEFEPAWKILHGWRVWVEGYPGVRTTLEVRPEGDTLERIAEDPNEFLALGMSVVAVPIVNAIPAVCAAAPGIRTYLDLPPITSRGFRS